MSNNEDPPDRPGLRTRAKNKNAHPGRVAEEALAVGLGAPSAKRRSAAQVKEDNAASTAAKADLESQLQERIAKIARMEEQLAEEQRLVVSQTFIF